MWFALYFYNQQHVCAAADGWMLHVYAHGFLDCYAMDSVCSLKGMPLAERGRNGRVHVLSVPLSHISRGLLLLPAALGGNP